MIAVSIDFIYKAERRKRLVLASVMHPQLGFDCNKQPNSGAKMIPVKYNHAHTYIRHVSRRSRVPNGRKFSFS